MLILTRRIGEKIIINHEIEVVIAGMKGNQVRLAINAPKDIPVHREEIEKKISKNLDMDVNNTNLTKIVYKKSFNIPASTNSFQ